MTACLNLLIKLLYTPHLNAYIFIYVRLKASVIQVRLHSDIQYAIHFVHHASCPETYMNKLANLSL